MTFRHDGARLLAYTNTRADRALSSGWVSLPAGAFDYVPWRAAPLASTRRLLAIRAVLMCASTPMAD